MEQSLVVVVVVVVVVVSVRHFVPSAVTWLVGLVDRVSVSRRQPPVEQMTAVQPCVVAFVDAHGA